MDHLKKRNERHLFFFVNSPTERKLERIDAEDLFSTRSYGVLLWSIERNAVRALDFALKDKRKTAERCRR